MTDQAIGPSDEAAANLNECARCIGLAAHAYVLGDVVEADKRYRDAMIYVLAAHEQATRAGGDSDTLDAIRRADALLSRIRP